MVKEVIGLMLIMGANIVLGTSLAQLKETFNNKSFYSGIYKAVSIIIAVILMYICSILNENVISISTKYGNYNIIDLMKFVAQTGIIYYGTQSIQKIITIIGLKINLIENIPGKKEEINNK